MSDYTAFCREGKNSGMKERQQAIALREAYYCGMFENMFNHFVCFRLIMDNRGKPIDLEYIDFNPAYEKHIELNSDAVIGRRLSEVFPGIEKENWIRVILEVAVSGEQKFIEEYSVIMGKWYQVCAYRPAVGYAAVIIEDISEKKECEGQLERYRELVEDARVIIMNLDENGKILFINEFGARLLGYKTAELVNRSYKGTLLPQFDSTGRDMWNEFDNIFIETDHKRSIREIVRKDGRRIWVEWTNRLRSYQGKEQLHLVSVGVDITQRRRAFASAKIVYERRLHKKIIDNLLEGHITQEEFFIIMEKDGPLMPQPLACCLVVFDFSKDCLKYLTEDTEEWQAWLDTAVDLISARFGGLVWHSDSSIVIVKNIDDSSRKAASHHTLWVQSIANEMKDVFRGIAYIIGVSGVHKDIKAVYCQAADAAKVGPIFHPDNNVYYWRDLGVSRLILEQVKSDRGFLFIQQYLGPLLEKPSVRHKELLITLKALLCGEPISLLAKRLYIHPKTIAFRKKRIERLLQVKLDDPETRLNITVALKLLELKEKL